MSDCGVVAKRADLIAVSEATAEFGVSRATLHRWLVTGRLTRYARAAGRPRVFLERRELRKLLEPKAERRRRAK